MKLTYATRRSALALAQSRAFVAKLAARADELIVGNPMDPDTDIGALATEDRKQAALDYIARARELGATVHAGGDAVVHERIHAAGFFRIQVFLELEALDRAAEADRKGRGIEARDRPDAALAAQRGRPGIGSRGAERAEQANACDDDATLAQGCDLAL